MAYFHKNLSEVFTFLFIVLSSSAWAQGLSLSGKISDKNSKEELIGANILLLQLPDSNTVSGSISDIDGSFYIANVKTGSYILKISYIGYKEHLQAVKIKDENVKVNIALQEDATILKETQVEAILPRMVMKGDTTVMNAGAFKVNPDADASDLVTKMPGIVIQDGKIQAQGEDVKRVLVDGKEFFGDDAMMTLKNLPAEIIDKVQVYDKMSDQDAFTGFSSGETDKTINIVTKEKITDGIFGRVYAGYGTDKRYNAGGNLNYFNEARRISIVGMSNNINIQNFGAEDLIGVAAGKGSKGGSGNMRGGGGNFGRGGGNVGNFISAGQGGINLSNGIGVNYVEDFGKADISASYFFNRTKNTNNSIIDRQYLTDNFQQFYNQLGNSRSYNNNHRINAKIEYKIDDKKSFTFKPQFSYQYNDSKDLINAITSLVNDEVLSKSNNDNQTLSKAYNLSNSILYKNKLGKQGRTISVNLNTGFNNRSSDNFLTAENFFSENIDSLIGQNQWADAFSKSINLSSSVRYTEPINENSQIQFDYSPSYRLSTSDRFTYQYNEATNDYTIADLSLSNQFENINWVHKIGAGYRVKFKEFTIKTSVDYQYSSLLSDRTYPNEAHVSQYYNNFLPSANLSYKFSKGNNISLFYRTNVSTPSVNQLQDVIDNSNPLILSSGNKDLNQEYNHNLGLRWRYAKAEKGRSAFIYISGGLKNHTISNATLLAIKDTMITDEILLPAGGQYTRPVNLDGSWNIRSFAVYGTPLLFMKSNLNLMGGISFNKSPNIVNESIFHNKTYNFNSGFVLSSNISEKVDFRLGYTANYNIVKYSQKSSSDNNYYTGLLNAAVNIMPWKGLNLATDLNYNHNAGLQANFNTNYTLWNAAIGYKFLKNNAAELKLQVFDILKSNNNISRTVTETYVQDSQVDLLGRYFMLQFTYKFNRFSGKS